VSSILQIKQYQEQMYELKKIGNRRQKYEFADISIQNLKKMIKINKQFLHLYGINCEGKVNTSTRVFNKLCKRRVPSSLNETFNVNDESIDDILSIL